MRFPWSHHSKAKKRPQYYLQPFFEFFSNYLIEIDFVISPSAVLTLIK